MGEILICAEMDYMPVLIVAIVLFALTAAAIVAGLIIFFKLKKSIETSKEFASRMVEEAVSESKKLHKEAVEKAKEEIRRERNTFDQDMRERKAEVQRIEQRLQSKEDNIDKKENALDAKLDALEQTKLSLAAQQESLNEMREEVGAAHDKMVAELEKISQLSKEEAKEQLLIEIEDDAKKDAVKIVREIEANAKEEGNKKAQEIVSLAIQKCAVDHCSEVCVSSVQLPNDDMKGRIIGREGRNIRVLEQATGVDFIIDDTPDTVVLSSFDPVRREVARLALEKLISDGRIHPGRIEELVEKCSKEVDNQIKEAGENAMFETGVFNLAPDIVKLLGRLKYRTSYGQNVLRHSIEVSHLAGYMAAELGADVTICKRAGLLHDIGKSIDRETEGTHISIGVDIAKKHHEKDAIIHCIAAHHNDIEPKTNEAILIQCADAISGSRPGARRESLENYVKRLEQLESIANGHTGVEKAYAVQAGREVRIIVKPEVVDDAATLFLARDIAKQIESEMQYPGQIKVNVIRELRSVENAK